VKREREKDDVEQSCQSENRSRSRIFDDSDSRTSSGEGRHRRREVVTEAKNGAAARGGGSAASSSSELLQVVLAAVRCRVCRIGFTTLPLVLLQEQPTVVLLFERDLVSPLAMDECGGHEDLRDSGHRSIIPYLHEGTRVILLNHALPEPAFLSAPVKRRMFKPFIAQGWAVTLRPGAR
jgi:hypothetical protein